MILHLNKTLSKDSMEQLALKNQAFCIEEAGHYILITGSGVKEIPADFKAYTLESWVFPNDNQLASREYIKGTRQVDFGSFAIGGDTKNTVLIGGPCSVESEAQIRTSATFMAGLGLKMFRGGCYKPRTSPYSFQGLGLEGLKLLAKMREEFGMLVITEARDASHIDEIIEYTDVIQVGAKAMYDQGILRACAKIKKAGADQARFRDNPAGIRTGGRICPFRRKPERGALRTRYPDLRNRNTVSHLTFVVWPGSKNTPTSRLSSTRATQWVTLTALPTWRVPARRWGLTVLLIEAHPTPKTALSDASQQLNHDEFAALLESLRPVAQSVGYRIV